MGIAKSNGPGKDKVKPCPFPIIKGNRTWKMPAMTSDFLAKLEKEEDLERYRKSFGHYS